MRAREAIIYATAALLATAMVVRFHRLGPAYFEVARTIFDHATPNGHDTARAMMLAREAAPLLPRGATVAMFRPSVPDDTTHFHTAVGMLPYQRVVARGKNAQFVITVGEPLNDPAYRLVKTFPEGNLYSR